MFAQVCVKRTAVSHHHKIRYLKHTQRPTSHTPHHLLPAHPAFFPTTSQHLTSSSLCNPNLCQPLHSYTRCFFSPWVIEQGGPRSSRKGWFQPLWKLPEELTWYRNPLGSERGLISSTQKGFSLAFFGEREEGAKRGEGGRLEASVGCRANRPGGRPGVGCDETGVRDSSEARSLEGCFQATWSARGCSRWEVNEVVFSTEKRSSGTAQNFLFPQSRHVEPRRWLKGLVFEECSRLALYEVILWRRTFPETARVSQ